MRRVVVEAPIDSMRSLLGDSQEMFGEIRSLEILTFLKDTPRETAMICRIEVTDPAESNLVVERNDISIKILEKEKKGTFICFVKRRRKAGLPRSSFIAGGGYLSTAYEIRDGNIRATFLGTSRQVRSFLQTIQKTGIRFKVIALADAKFSPDSPLSGLTDTQIKVLKSAFNLGYYDLPKKITSDELAKKLNMRSSTFVLHRIKAERRILAKVLK